MSESSAHCRRLVAQATTPMPFGAVFGCGLKPVCPAGIAGAPRSLQVSDAIQDLADLAGLEIVDWFYDATRFPM